MSGIDRKAEHIRIAVGEDVRPRANPWDSVTLVHDALPEIDFDEVTTEVELFGHKLAAPIVIAGMTGGTPTALRINDNLAAAAAQLEVGMGVGSQRPALQDGGGIETYSVVRDHGVPLMIANLGIPQFLEQSSGVPLDIEHGHRALEMVDGDVLAIHLNYLQEMAQPEGDLKARGAMEKLRQLCAELPVIAKETGAGVSHATALKLKEAGVRGIDVGGQGGTSFAAIEANRWADSDHPRAFVGEEFRDWGIPTPIAILESSVGLPLIATGGLRNGTDAARALAMGASAAGYAGRLISAAQQDRASVVSVLEEIIHGLRVAMFLTGCRHVVDLADSRYVLHGRLRDWGHMSKPVRS